VFLAGNGREREREREEAGETDEQNLRDRGRINEMQIAFKSARACLPLPRLPRASALVG